VTGPPLLITRLTPFHQESCIGDLNVEFEKLESTETLDSAQAATATSHNEWQSVDLSVQKNLSNLFSSSKAVKEKKTVKVNEVFQEYYNQGEPRKGDHQTDLIRICQI